jgi:hypothetical protein
LLAQQFGQVIATLVFIKRRVTQFVLKRCKFSAELLHFLFQRTDFAAQGRQLLTLRGSLLDPFRKSDERRLARELLDGYRADIERLLPELTSANHALAVRIASLPDKVRGYGHVRQASATAVSTERDQLLAQWRQPQAQAETAWATELAR